MGASGREAEVRGEEIAVTRRRVSPRLGVRSTGFSRSLCHFSGEGPFAIAAAKKYDRIVQIGTNQHSCAHYRKAVEIIQSGQLGNIMEVKVWDAEHYGSLGHRPPDRDPPPELDWDFYVGPSPLRPYNPCYHAFDWFKDFGGGFQVAWGVHHYDIVHWAMGVQWPKTVTANGGNVVAGKTGTWLLLNVPSLGR